MTPKSIIGIILTVILFCSCSAPKLTYFEDMQGGNSEQVINAQSIKVRPDDKISIMVNSKDPLLVNLFNLPIPSKQIGTLNTTSASSQGVSGYTVDANGNIDFPVVGEIHVAGLTRQEVAAQVKKQLIDRSLVKDPLVTVEFMNLTVSVLGEVNKPGRINIDKDKFTLLDALSMAGDLTVWGKRDQVMVQRQIGDKQEVFNINLNSGKDLYSSPAYYLQQNDVIYVAPNDMKSRQSTVNGNTVRSASFWISLASLLTTVSVLIFK